MSTPLFQVPSIHETDPEGGAHCIDPESVTGGVVPPSREPCDTLPVVLTLRPDHGGGVDSLISITTYGV